MLMSSLHVYASRFSLIDYIAYAWLVLIFFMAIFLAIVLVKKSVKLAGLSLLFALIVLFAGPFLLKNTLDQHLRPIQVTLQSQKQLHFSDIFIVDVSLQNLSKNPFSICLVEARIVQKSESTLKKILYKLKPLRKKTITSNDELAPSQSKELQIVFDNYNAELPMDVLLDARCY
ncbi:MAG: DUF2393 family protein [Sulfurospirillum sp.]|nr:DUF2393 family protein [Sulfurospirillum sp.]